MWWKNKKSLFPVLGTTGVLFSTLAVVSCTNNTNVENTETSKKDSNTQHDNVEKQNPVDSNQQQNNQNNDINSVDQSNKQQNSQSTSTNTDTSSKNQNASSDEENKNNEQVDNSKMEQNQPQAEPKVEEQEKEIVVKNEASKKTNEEVELEEIKKEKEIENKEIQEQNAPKSPEEQKQEQFNQFKQEIKDILFQNNNTIKVLDKYKNETATAVYDKNARGGDLIELDFIVDRTMFSNVNNIQNYKFYMTKATKKDDELGIWKNVELVVKNIDKTEEFRIDDLKVSGFLIKESEKTKMSNWLTQKEVAEDVKEFYPSLLAITLLSEKRNAAIEDGHSDENPEAWFGNIDRNNFLDRNSTVTLGPSLTNSFVDKPDQNPIKYNAKVVEVQFDDFKGTLSIEMEIYGEDNYKYTLPTVRKTFNYSGFKTIDIRDEKTHPLKITISPIINDEIQKRNTLKAKLNEILTAHKDNLNHDLLKELKPSHFISLYNVFKNSLSFSVNDPKVSTQLRQIFGEQDFRGKILKRYGSGQSIGIFPMAAVYMDNPITAFNGFKNDPSNILELLGMSVTKFPDSEQLWVRVDYKTRYFLSRPNSWMNLESREFTFIGEPIEYETSLYIPYNTMLNMTK